MTTDPTHQLELFRQATEALGGQHATARYLNVSPRTIRALLTDPASPHSRELHDGFLRDIAAALAKHATHCRELERQLTPAFTANLTSEQLERQGKPDARRFDARENANG